MTQVEASHQIAVASALVAQWRWAIDPAMSAFPADHPAWRPFGACQADIMRQLRDTAAWEHRRASAAPDSAPLRERALLADALLWHQDAPEVCWPPIIRAEGPEPKRHGRRVLYDIRDLDRWADRLDGQPLDDRGEEDEAAAFEKRWMDKRRARG